MKEKLKNSKFALLKFPDPFYICSFIAGLFLALSFPKFNLWITGFFSFSLMIFLCKFSESLKKLFFGVLMFGVSYNFLLLYWLIYTIEKFGKLPFPIAFLLLFLLAFYLSLYYVPVFLCSKKLGLFDSSDLLKAIIFSLAFAGAEFLKSKLFTGFAWESPGYLFIHISPLLQTASLWGISGLNFLSALLSYFIFFLLNIAFPSPPLKTKKYFLLNLAGFFIIFALLFIYGIKSQNRWDSLIKKEKNTLKLALLQGNVPQEIKISGNVEYSIKTYKDLILKALEKKPDVILLPETALNFFFPVEDGAKSFVDFLKTHLSDKEITVIFGTFRVGFSREVKIYNTLVVWEKGKVIDFYDKEKLVPFGEYVPLEDTCPVLKKLYFFGSSLSSGFSKILIFHKKKKTYRVLPLICFESAFSDISCKRARLGMDFLFVATNDAWFDNTSAPYQHFQMARVRAVEVRRYLIQVANTGISGVIDPAGRVVFKTRVGEKAFPLVKIKLVSEKSFFVRIGDVIGLCGGAVYIVMFLFCVFRKRTAPAKKSFR